MNFEILINYWTKYFTWIVEFYFQVDGIIHFVYQNEFLNRLRILYGLNNTKINMDYET